MSTKKLSTKNRFRLKDNCRIMLNRFGIFVVIFIMTSILNRVSMGCECTLEAIYIGVCTECDEETGEPVCIGGCCATCCVAGAYCTSPEWCHLATCSCSANECIIEEECQAQGKHCINGTCQECGTGFPCPEGQTCIDGTCYTHYCQSPSDCGPLGCFNCVNNECQSVYATAGTIEINPDGSWHDITGKEITVLKGTIYSFRVNKADESKNWMENKPEWTGMASGTGVSTISVTFDGSSGTLTVNGGCGDSGKYVIITVVEPTVYQVGFGEDHAMYKTPDTNDGWDDGIILITDPIYNSETGDYNSVCVTKNSSTVSLTNVKLKVSNALSYSTTIRVDANGTEDWNESSDITFAGTTSGEATLGITGNIINEVKKYNGNFQIQWQYKVPSPGGTNTYYSINTTSHTMYVTWGTPSGSNVTVKRIDWVCVAADEDNDIGVAADDVYISLKPKIYSPAPAPRNGPTPIWLIHKGAISQCPGLAMYINAHFQMLGLGSGEIRYCWAKADGTCIYDLYGYEHYQTRNFPVSGHSSPTSHDDYLSYEKLKMMDSSGNTNNYEATCYFNSTYYALLGNNDGRFSSPTDVITS